jgi:hypothetical protein
MKGHIMSVIKGKRQTADRVEVTLLLANYRAAKDAEAAANIAATECREALVEIAGDAEILVDAHNLQLCKVPERSRRSLPLVEALELHPDLEVLVHHSEYRVITR